MKAVRLLKVGEPLQDCEVPTPNIEDNEVLVRIKAAGICHSDVHYADGLSPVSSLPLTLGHEIAGVIEEKGEAVTNVNIGDRVALHYLLTCGQCAYCISGNEQFCPKAKMLGHHMDGGYADYVVVPSRNAVILPSEINFPEGTTLMCASATAYHAINKGRLKPGDRVAVYGVGGLGQSAVQLAKAFGATQVFAIDLDPRKLKLAEAYGAIPLNAKSGDPVEAIKAQTNGEGVEVALEFIGLPKTQKQALQSAAPMGRVVLVGLSNKPLQIDPYTEILGKEIELIGSNDHHLSELGQLMDFVSNGLLDVSEVVSSRIPLEAEAINEVFDRLRNFGGGIRNIIEP